MENITLIWYDESINSTEDTKQTAKMLRQINDYVVFHTNHRTCAEYVKSIQKEKIFLIISGACSTDILPLVHDLEHIDSIFVFCMKTQKYEYLRNEYSKIIGIFNELSPLIDSIKENAKLVEKHIQTFSCYKEENQTSTRDLSKESAAFLWFQLFKDVILKMPQTEQSKQEMIRICRDYYRGNSKELKYVEEFENEYKPDDSIRWYTKESFIHKLINKALRTEEIEQLYIFRLFISNLSTCLGKESQRIQREQAPINVYRGERLSNVELEKLKANEGKLISINGFLSTSRSHELALRFACKQAKRTGVFPVLFHIQCYMTGESSDIIFADITELSHFPEEQEVLFDLGAAFRIESIHFEDKLNLWHIRLKATNEGAQIAQEYIELNKKDIDERTVSVSIMFGRLLADMGHYDKSQNYFEKLLTDSADEDVASIYHNIGRAQNFKGKYDQALESFVTSLSMKRSFLPSNHPSIADTLNNIGVVYRSKGEYDRALEYHMKSLEMKEICLPLNHASTADTLNNIGLIYQSKNEYDRALEYYIKSLKMKEICLLPNHASTAVTLNNIGMVYGLRGQDNLALEHFMTSLKMKEICLPPNHDSTAATLENIGMVYRSMGEYDQALEYYMTSLKMKEICLPLNHDRTADTLNNIGIVYDSKGEYDHALEYYMTSLKMKEICLPPNHDRTADTLNNIGMVYRSKGEYTRALEYFKKSLKMKEICLPQNHASTADTLNNIGLVYQSKSECNRALEYFIKSLKMKEICLPPNHDRTADTLYNIGLTYQLKGEYARALDYCTSGLHIYKSKFHQEHPVIRTMQKTIQGISEASAKLHGKAVKLLWFFK
ncbi:unnamed protein product [Didymodactylos carnosus]|uniref:ADP ribosyltransferase domain-containing protein n=1 Tax=Didymodactylos carnosus TaxID=1234261 RepID=A0A815BSD7_9BILA|nr:unnamed protein product [Didymodactylos carnosus]CAF4063593.1 unnamed protein product [Didymodactylos carnosus]